MLKRVGIPTLLYTQTSSPLSFPSAGKGRGRQVIAVARTADLVLMMLDAGKGDIQRLLLEKELDSVGIRLNKRVPNIYFKVSRVSYKAGMEAQYDACFRSQG